MLKNNKANLVIAFILAVALWFYVVGEMNPVTRKTYRSIPITLTNEQTLNDNGFAVLRSNYDNLRITVTGKRDRISKLDKTEIVVTCDLSNCADGKNVLPLDIKIPEDIDIENQSINEVTVTVEDLVTDTRKVHVDYSDSESVADDQEATTLKVDPEAVVVKGAKSLVKSVLYVKAKVPTASLADDVSSITCNLTPTDSNGKAVDKVSLSETTCKVTSKLSYRKEVPFKVAVKDKNKKVKKIVSYDKMITVIGEKAELDKLKAVKAKTVDISNVKKDTMIRLKPILEGSVKLSSTTEAPALYVEVKK